MDHIVENVNFTSNESPTPLMLNIPKAKNILFVNNNISGISDNRHKISLACIRLQPPHQGSKRLVRQPPTRIYQNIRFEQNTANDLIGLCVSKLFQKLCVSYSRK